MLRHRGVHPLCLNFYKREEERGNILCASLSVKTTKEIPL